jgi:hypothetical protein
VHLLLADRAWGTHSALNVNGSVSVEEAEPSCRRAVEHYKYVAEGGPWGREVQQAYWDFSGDCPRTLTGSHK